MSLAGTLQYFTQTNLNDLGLSQMMDTTDQNCLEGRVPSWIKITGRKEELVARVLSAFKTDVVLTKTAEEVEREIVSDYKACLKMDANIAQRKLGPKSW